MSTTIRTTPSPLLLLLVAFTTASLLQERQGEVDGVVHVHEHEHDNSHKHKQRHYNKHEHTHNHRHVHDHGHEAAHSEEHKHTVAGEHRHKHWRLYRLNEGHKGKFGLIAGDFPKVGKAERRSGAEWR